MIGKQKTENDCNLSLSLCFVLLTLMRTIVVVMMKMKKKKMMMMKMTMKIRFKSELTDQGSVDKESEPKNGDVLKSRKYMWDSEKEENKADRTKDRRI